MDRSACAQARPRDGVRRARRADLGLCGGLGKKLRDCWSIIALSGVLTALIDETIQLLNGRTSAVKDVWIDSGGFALGMLLIAFLLARNGKRGGFSKISDRNG